MKRLITALSLCAIAACGSDNNTDTNKGGNGNDTLVDTNFAVVITSDFQKSTGVALLGLDSQTVLEPKCITSGTKLGSLSATLSGDVVLPSQTQANHEIVLIDRTNGALTYVDPNNCTPRMQVSVGTTFFSNPHDVASISSTKSYVTRYGVNASPTDATDKGDDIVIINPQNGNTMGYIDLSGSSYTTANGVLARPDRIWVVDSNAYVSLGEISSDFKTLGIARIVVIDTASDAVIGTISIDSQMGCSQIVGDAHALAVGCGGNAYNDPTNLNVAGVAFTSTSGVISSTALNLSDVNNRFVNPAVLASVDGGLYLTSTFGDYATIGDALYSYNASTKVATHVADSKPNMGFGGAVFNANSQTAFVANGDTGTPAIRVFKLANGTFTESTAISVGADTGLPPRAISRL